jgi:hypothetical protein
MRLREVADLSDPEPSKLIGLVDFLSGRAQDTSAKRQIDKDTFIQLAQQLKINITDSNLQDFTSRPPLSNVLEPYDPNSGVIVFRGGDTAPTEMPVAKAQDIVANMAKRAMK